MTGFTKLHGSILESTIWQESPVVCKVWVTMLAMADAHGEIQASIPGLAHRAIVSIAEIEDALKRFMAPDEYSRTRDFEGRRIEAIDGGWRLLNHGKYRAKMSQEDILEKGRMRQQRFRDRQRVTQECDASVTERSDHDESLMSRHTEADTEAESQNLSAHSSNEREAGSLLGVSRNGDKPATGTASSSEKRLAAVRRAELVAELYRRYPRKIAKADAFKAIERAIVAVAKDGATDTHPDFCGDEVAAAQWLEGRVVLYAQSPQARQLDRTKVPYPATWFNRARYCDDECEWNHIGRSELREMRVRAEASIGSRESFQESAVLCIVCGCELESLGPGDELGDKFVCSEKCSQKYAS